MTIQQRVVALCGALDDACVMAESREEEGVRVREEALLERDDDERNRVPMCCMCERWSVASIPSRIYTGAGLNCSSAIISDHSA